MEARRSGWPLLVTGWDTCGSPIRSKHRSGQQVWSRPARVEMTDAQPHRPVHRVTVKAIAAPAAPRCSHHCAPTRHPSRERDGCRVGAQDNGELLPADRPGAVPPAVLDRGPGPVPRGGHCRRVPGRRSQPEPGRTGHASTTGRGSRCGLAGNAAAGTGCWPAAPSPTRRRSPTTPATGPAGPAPPTWPGPRTAAGISKSASSRLKARQGWTTTQVRDWRAWYAHITLSMLALAWLAAAHASAAKGEPPPATRA